MKKSLLVIICLFSILWNTNAFFWSPSSLDLYKNIDKWINELNNKILRIELTGWENDTSLIEEINKLAVLNDKKWCLDEAKSLTEQEFKKIIEEENIWKIAKYIDSKCTTWTNNSDIKYSIDLLNDYLYFFKLHLSNSINVSSKKADRIYKISNIWLYSDWIIENSWFDLISDIEEIDKIIFASENEYIWSKNIDLAWTINWKIDIIDYKMQQDFKLNNKIKLNNNSRTFVQKNNDWLDSINSIDLENKYVCSVSNGDWLSSESLANLLNNVDDIKKPKIYNYKNKIKKNNLISLNKKSTNNNNWGYEKVNDNSQWPCEGFFCIDINFRMYQHNLFWWWENITIEYLINRSNEHLRKFAATSLVQSKMSVNLFELWLKDLNLPSIFHMAFQISTKPIPILTLENYNRKDNSEFTSKKLLEKYYNANWLDYKRRNDLVLFKKIEQEKQVILNNENLPISNAILKNKEYYNDYLTNEKKKIKIINKAIEKKVSYWVLQTFEEQYIELDKFTVGINNYVENLHSIILKMLEIPVDKGTN